MAFALLLAGAAQCDPLIEGDVVAHDCRFTDHDAHSVVNKQAAPDLGSGVDFNASEQAGYLGQESRRKAQPVLPEPVVDAVSPERVQSGVAEQDFEIRPRRRIALEDGGYVFAHRLEKGHKYKLSAVSSQLNPLLAPEDQPVAGQFELHRNCGHLLRFFTELIEQDAGQITFPEIRQHHHQQPPRILRATRDL